MRSKWIVFVFVAFLIFGLSSHLSAMGERPSLLIKNASDFELNDTSGNPVKLSDYRGKVVLLNFFATWCPPCREEMPSIQRLHDKLKSRDDIAVLTVAIDRGDKNKVLRFAKENGYTFKILLDSDNKVSNNYAVSAVPTTYIIGKKGDIIEKVIGARDWSDPKIIGKLKKIAGN